MWFRPCCTKRKTCSFYRSRSSGGGDGAESWVCRESTHTLRVGEALACESVTLFKRAPICPCVFRNRARMYRANLRGVLTSATIHAVRANLAGAWVIAFLLRKPLTSTMRIAPEATLLCPLALSNNDRILFKWSRHGRRYAVWSVWNSNSLPDNYCSIVRELFSSHSESKNYFKDNLSTPGAENFLSIFFLSQNDIIFE